MKPTQLTQRSWTTSKLPSAAIYQRDFILGTVRVYSYYINVRSGHGGYGVTETAEHKERMPPELSVRPFSFSYFSAKRDSRRL